MSSKHISHSELKRKWQQENSGAKQLTHKDLYLILRRNSLITRLRRRALVLAILGLSGPLWAYFGSQLHFMSPLVQVSYSVFMLIASAVSLYWWKRLGEVFRYMTIPVIEAQRKIERLDRLRRNIKICSWIVGAPIIILLFCDIYDFGDQSMFYGAVVGLIIGSAIGFFLEYLNRRQMKEVKKSFFDEEDGFSDCEA